MHINNWVAILESHIENCRWRLGLHTRCLSLTHESPDSMLVHGSVESFVSYTEENRHASYILYGTQSAYLHVYTSIKQDYLEQFKDRNYNTDRNRSPR